MLCRTARVYIRVAYRPLRCQRQAYFLRSYSTSPSHNEVNPLAHDTPQETTTMEEKQSGLSPIIHPSTRTAHIRLWEPLHNVADVWIVTRALEKKYGKILETHFFKDFEIPVRYQMLAFIIFRDLASMERIPKEGEQFTVLAPAVPKKPIYELGLEDIELYAGTEEFQPGFEFDKVEADTTRRVIGGRIRHSSIEYSSAPEHRRFFQGTSHQTLSHFLKWGGFNPATIDTSRPAYEGDLFKANSRQESARMRAALQLCSRLTSEPIPQEVASTDTTPEGQTVPTPGPSLESARIFAGLYDTMPSAALGKIRKEIVDEEVGYEKPIPATPSIAQEPIPETKGPEPAASSPPSPKSPNIPSPQPVKRPPMSPEAKQKLESQIHAARLLQLAATPVKRKQLKPAVIEPVKNPKRAPKQWSLDEADIPVVEEKKSFLATLAGLFGR